MNTVLNTYAAISNNVDIRLKSSSGGVFTLLSEYIFSQNGVAYGVAMSEECRSAVFLRANDISELAPICGSKYLQAKVGDTFNRVKADLEAGTPVLFTGVGCQINGLKTFLGKDYENLYCVDVLCHGVPSPALWRKYVDNFEKKNGRKLISVNFRCKHNGWANYRMKRIDSDNQESYSPMRKDPYMQMFLRDYCLRPSCYECHAKIKKRSDMTIADFWGIESVAPEMNDGKGTSLVLVRTEKGRQLFCSIKDRLDFKEVSYEDGVKENPVEYKSVERPSERDTFFGNMNKMSFEKLRNKYIKEPFWKKVGRKVILIIKNQHIQ